MSATSDLIVRVITDVSKAKGLEETGAKASKFSKGMATASKVAAGALVAVGAAAVKAGQAAADDAQSQALLSSAMQKNAGASAAQIAATEDWISKMGLATGVADDELRPALATLTRATGDVEKSQAALATAMDISAATGKPLESVSTAIAKGYAGQTSALGRLVPGISKAALESKDMTKIMGELAAKTEGAAAESADTAAGKMQIMTLAMGEAEETMGAALLPTMAKFATILTKVATWIGKNQKLFTVIIGVIAAFAATILVLNAAITVYTTVTTIAGIVSSTAWLAALGPILLVVAAVAAVIAIVVLLWKKSETFRKVVLGVWSAIKTGARVAGNAIKAIWRAVFAALTAYVRVYVTVFRIAFDAIKTVVRSVSGAIKTVWNALMLALKTAVNSFRDVGKAAWNAVKTTVNAVSSAIKVGFAAAIAAAKRVVEGLGAILSAPFDATKTAIDAVGDAIDDVIGFVEDLIDAIGRIKIPKISLPKIPGVGRAVVPTGGAVLATPVPRGVGAPVPMTTTGGGGPNVTILALDPEGTARALKRVLDRHEGRVGLRQTGASA